MAGTDHSVVDRGILVHISSMNLQFSGLFWAVGALLLSEGILKAFNREKTSSLKYTGIAL